MMSSLIITANFGQTVDHNSNELIHTKDNVFVDGIIAILSEHKLQPWLDSGLKKEYQRRYGLQLPEDWIQVLRDNTNGVIEVETKSYSNVTKTFIQLSLKVAKDVSAPPMSPPMVTRTVTFANAMSSPPMEPMDESMSLIDLNDMDCKKQTKAIDKCLDQMMNNHNKDHSMSAYVDILSNFDEVFESSKYKKILKMKTNTIPSPVLPKVNPRPRDDSDFFDVVVLLAANPNNFIVVPFHNLNFRSDFQKLKEELNHFYDRNENLVAMANDDVSAGMFIAGRSDKCWYRMKVTHVIKRDPLQVIACLCDYGEHRTLHLQDIQPLGDQFYNLPAQALRASLATVEPIGQEWDLISSVEFRKLVENVPFVSTVYAINEVDEQPVLSLSLCDTTGKDDIFIGPVLVERGLAKKKIFAVL